MLLINQYTEYFCLKIKEDLKALTISKIFPPRLSSSRKNYLCKSLYNVSDAPDKYPNGASNYIFIG